MLKLVEDWKKSYKWFSQQAFLASTALLTVWGSLVALQSYIPAKVVTGIAAGICVLGFIGRMVDQSKPDEQ